MNTDFGKGGDECPRLLDLIPCEIDWLKRDAGGGGGGKGLGAPMEKKLELTLAPPRGEDWAVFEEVGEMPPSTLPLSYFSKLSKSSDAYTFVGAKRGFADTVEPKPEVFHHHHQKQLGPLQLEVIAGFGKESSQKANGRAEQQQSLERNLHPASKDGALTNSSAQIRTSCAPVVGWPPIRSFRKNIGSSSSKPSSDLQNGAQENGVKAESPKKGFFVKINMDGILIGRKVDLNAYDGYQKLSSAVQDLFCGLLAAQRDPTAPLAEMSEKEKMAFAGLLDGSGEYALVYEDNEGDRMLVGDVPWEMFVSTAKRLRVLKRSELSTISLATAVNINRVSDGYAD
ncbi:hypothetical protein HPP92_024048 [Vanilla planifolia]|uniref:Auxin-responsive protein n=1 Tax=Vanilla planifolia TaxID=51239 RepID=A0A835PLN9_VANPL|nr:hypothetical protein HPP92_024451 [Vanilla planifolia]KAG0456260.1 hypothetical protein HPP92_024048 [Vanilla planifolia]